MIDAWDRVGQYMQAAGALGERIAQRHLRMWTTVSRHLDQGDYGADEFVRDGATAAMVAKQNMMDFWSVMTQPPDRDNVARPVPTAFLLFDRRDGYVDELVAPVTIPVPATEGELLPRYAQIELSGDADGVKALLDRLAARLDQHRRVYVLEAIGIPPGTPRDRSTADARTGRQKAPDAGAAEVPPLVHGTYEGIVYLFAKAELLAHLQVVVADPPWADRANQ